MRSNWIVVSLINFLVAAVMGLLLRLTFIWEIPWLNYRNMLHGHSHVAMLGWVYMALYTMFVHLFVPKHKQSKPIYSRLFWFTQFTVLGMFFSFPIQGYAAVSITFSALHIVASYLFAIRFWKDCDIRYGHTRILVKSSLVFMLLSTLGVWAMGPIMANGLKSSPLYQTAIQFYLHFQFNGWFALAVLALIFQQFHKVGYIFKEKDFSRFLILYFTSLFFTFFHILEWAYGYQLLFLFNAIGVCLQLLAFLSLFWAARTEFRLFLQKQKPLARLLLTFALFSFLLKAFLQLALMVPQIAEVSTTIRNFMIGYIHLTMLGFITGGLFYMLHKEFPVFINTVGILIFICGFAGTELMLFLQGYYYWEGWGMLSYYNELLSGLSFLLPLSLIFLLAGTKLLPRIGGNVTFKHDLHHEFHNK